MVANPQQHQDGNRRAPEARARNRAARIFILTSSLPFLLRVAASVQALLNGAIDLKSALTQRRFTSEVDGRWSEAEGDARTRASTTSLSCSGSTGTEGILVPFANFVGSDRNSTSRSLVQTPCLARRPSEYRN